VRVLVVNPGSSTLKLRLLDGGDELVAERDLDVPGASLDRDELGAALDGLQADAIGYRVVHGGRRFHGPARVDAETLAGIAELRDLAPLHQDNALAAIDAVSRARPGVPGVACFDTAFHANLPPAASTYALPGAWRDRWNLRRYGFHGLSHAYVARRVAELLGRPATGLGTVSCHLGAGASLCAIRDGESIDTTMGFTPLEGLVMATRSGSVDPGLLLWLVERAGVSVGALGSALEHDSGLLGLSGTADMRRVVADEAAGREPAALALDVYAHRLRAGIAAMTAALGGLDVLAFTGGVGEHAPAVRARAAEGLGFLGIGLDPAANEAATTDADVTAGAAPVRTFVVTAREDLEIARQVRRLAREAPDRLEDVSDGEAR
jgi:acetate kinase